MSQIKERQFRLEGGEASPFIPSKTSKNKSSSDLHLGSESSSKKTTEKELNGPSGSHWGLRHINWLHLHFAVGYDWTHLFSPGNELSQDSTIILNFHHKLSADWSWICHTKHGDHLSINALFQRLISQRKADDDYKTATHASTGSDSSSSPESQILGSSTSPQQNRQSTMSHQDRETTPTPHDKGFRTQPSTPGFIGRKRPLEITPSPPGQTGETRSPGAQGDKTATHHQRTDGSTSASPTTPKSQITRGSDEHGIADVQAVMESAQDNQLRRLVQEEEDEEQEAQGLILQHQVKEEEDEPSEAASTGISENQVQETGSAFLGVVLDAIEATGRNEGVDKKMLGAQNLEMDVLDSSVFAIVVDGIHITAQPDRSLFCSFGEPGQQRTVEVMIEFKKRDHMKAPSRILGQECAELLGAVLKEKEFLDRVAKGKKRADGGDKIFTSWLISWHGLMAYVSRLDVTYEYLEQLKRGSKGLQSMAPPPRIRRSQLLNLTKPNDRISLATIAASIAIEQLSQYKRNRDSGLIKRLIARSEEPQLFLPGSDAPVS